MSSVGRTSLHTMVFFFCKRLIPVTDSFLSHLYFYNSSRVDFFKMAAILKWQCLLLEKTIGPQGCRLPP